MYFTCTDRLQNPALPAAALLAAKNGYILHIFTFMLKIIVEIPIPRVGGCGMVSNYAPLATLSYAAMPRVSTGGRAYLPVESSEFMYSHFQYVSGVPRQEDQVGISIGKLQILNTLIDQLIKLSEHNPHDALAVHNVQNMYDIDSLINYVGEKVHTEIAYNKDICYAPLPPEAACLINLTI